MALVKCGECSGQISSAAKACPHCGAKPPYRPGVGIIVFFVVMLGLGLKAISVRNDAPLAQPVSDPVAEARGACMLMIKQRLHDPDSAEFGASDAAKVYQENDLWVVRRPVRARNGFNALRTSVFECRMKKTGDSWQPVSVREISN